MRSAPSVKVVVRMDSVAGATTAPPRPWNARATIKLALALGQATGQRRRGEQQEPDEQHPLVPEQVRRAPAEQQEAGERDRVGVDDPLQVDDREAEVIADRRQRDVHDRHVEDDHELREAAEDEGPALRDVRG